MSYRTHTSGSPTVRKTAWLHHLQRLTLLIGSLLLSVFVLARVYGTLVSRIALYSFDEEHKPASKLVASGLAPPGKDIDFSLWSAKRIQQYKASFPLVQPIAVLDIPRLGLTAPVFEGTDDITLNQGLGRIAGTSELGQEGTVGIAGHRDGFFRPLKDIMRGDSIVITLPAENDIYVVDQTEIVDPDDVGVLKRRSTSGISLVTCYPFYFLGDAPRRFIVQASLTERTQLSQSPIANPDYQQTQKEQ